jgi:predicted enzyme related to lactoylglutathione lyase
MTARGQRLPGSAWALFAVAGLDEAARRSDRRGGLVIGAMDEAGQEKAG